MAVLPASCGDAALDPTPEAATQLLTALDSAFNRGDAKAFGRLFDASSLRGKSSRRVRRLLRHDGKLRQQSVVGQFAAMSRIGLLRADTTLWRVGPDPDQPGPDAQMIRRYVAFEVHASGPQILVYEDVDPGADRHLAMPFTGVYSCPPCNFQIGATSLQDWLVVPSPKQVAGCVEMVSFYRPGDDIQLTLSVHRNPGHQPAERFLQQLIQAQTDAVLPSLAERGEIVAWRPPFYAAGAPTGLHGATSRPKVPGLKDTTLYLITRTTQSTSEPDHEICYLLTVRGSNEARASHGDDISTWLASFQLIDIQHASGLVGFNSASMHSGGSRLEQDGSFHNEATGFRCRGPASWKATLQAENGLFGLTYQCPDGLGSLNVTAYPRQPGTLDERRAGALRVIRQRIDRLGLEVVEDSDWLEGSSAAGTSAIAVRDLQSQKPADGRGAPTHRRLDRILLFEDALVLIAGHLEAEEAVVAYHALCDSLRR